MDKDEAFEKRVAELMSWGFSEMDAHEAVSMEFGYYNGDVIDVPEDEEDAE